MPGRARWGEGKVTRLRLQGHEVGGGSQGSGDSLGWQSFQAAERGKSVREVGKSSPARASRSRRGEKAELPNPRGSVEPRVPGTRGGGGRAAPGAGGGAPGSGRGDFLGTQGRWGRGSSWGSEERAERVPGVEGGCAGGGRGVPETHGGWGECGRGSSAGGGSPRRIRGLECGRPAYGAASRRQRPRDWEGGEPDVGHGV